MSTQKNKKEKRVIPTREIGKPIDQQKLRPSQILFQQAKAEFDIEILNEDNNTHPTLPTTPTLPTILTRPTLPTTPTQDKLSIQKKVNSLRSKNSVIEDNISPTKNFTKVANSVTKAIPEGLFIGKSKFIYDYLYLQTRGAITPQRSIQITKSKIMEGANIGSEKTFLKNINHLKSIGLITVFENEGKHGGNEYEVFLPEELPTLPTPPNPRYPQQKVGTLPTVESSVGSVGLIVENKDSYENAKTYLKTNTIDDEKKQSGMFIEILTLLEKTSVELTGKGLQEKESGKWKILIELLIDELKVAALRTETISSVPAFLTEHLRRRLGQTEENQNKAKKESYKKDTVGKSEFNSDALETISDSFMTEDEYIPEKLTEKQREAVLSSMKEFIKQGKEEFVMSLKSTYQVEDWSWLIQNISID
jgi:hypothetical protein